MQAVEVPYQLWAHDELCRDPRALLQTTSLPIHQVLYPSMTARVEKPLRRIRGNPIDQLRRRWRGRDQGTRQSLSLTHER